MRGLACIRECTRVCNHSPMCPSSVGTIVHTIHTSSCAVPHRRTDPGREARTHLCGSWLRIPKVNSERTGCRTQPRGLFPYRPDRQGWALVGGISPTPSCLGLLQDCLGAAKQTPWKTWCSGMTTRLLSSCTVPAKALRRLGTLLSAGALADQAPISYGSRMWNYS